MLLTSFSVIVSAFLVSWSVGAPNNQNWLSQLQKAHRILNAGVACKPYQLKHCPDHLMQNMTICGHNRYQDELEFKNQCDFLSWACLRESEKWTIMSIGPCPFGNKRPKRPGKGKPQISNTTTQLPPEDIFSVTESSEETATASNELSNYLGPQEWYGIDPTEDYESWEALTTQKNKYPYDITTEEPESSSEESMENSSEDSEEADPQEISHQNQVHIKNIADLVNVFGKFIKGLSNDPKGYASYLYVMMQTTE